MKSFIIACLFAAVSARHHSPLYNQKMLQFASGMSGEENLVEGPGRTDLNIKTDPIQICNGTNTGYCMEVPEAINLGLHDAGVKAVETEKKPETMNDDVDPPLCASDKDTNCNLTPQVTLYPSSFQ